MPLLLTGLVEMQRQLAQLEVLLPEAAAGALYREGERIMARSKEEFVPVDTGALKASGHVRAPRPLGHTWEVELVYGGPAIPYAVAQHETPWYVHRVGQWKYLEQPFMQAVDGMLERVAADVEF